MEHRDHGVFGALGKMELEAMAPALWLDITADNWNEEVVRRKNKGTAKGTGTRSDLTRGLGAAFPLSAAVEPIAHGGEPGGICVE